MAASRSPSTKNAYAQAEKIANSIEKARDLLDGLTFKGEALTIIAGELYSKIDRALYEANCLVAELEEPKDA